MDHARLPVGTQFSLIVPGVKTTSPGNSIIKKIIRMGCKGVIDVARSLASLVHSRR
jgi:hypothetical protein